MSTGSRSPEEKALIEYLTLGPTVQSDTSEVWSSLALALRDARRITGRDESTGVALEDTYLGSWAGALTYMALVDQLGSAVRPKVPARAATGNDFVKALTYFTALPETEISALYALRCAFAHDYSLLNKSDKQPLRHKFQLLASVKDPVVTLPEAGLWWDGMYGETPVGTATVVKLGAFANIVEQIVRDAIPMARAGQLDIALSGGAAEMTARYMIRRMPAMA